MKDLPKVGFVCTGETALELSGAICCVGRLMRYFNENGYMTGGCYSCIAPSKQIKLLKERIEHMCACNDVVVTVGCDGFRKNDVIADIVLSMGSRELTYFSCKLSADEYTDCETGKVYKCFPTMGVAAIYSSTLILCVSSDVAPTLGKISTIMPSLSFATRNVSKKEPAKSLELENLMSDFYLEGSFQE